MFVPLQLNKANLQRLLTALGTYVSSFSGGTTGLTPSTPTTGDVVLSGTLGVPNGGTGSTTSTGTAASGVVLRTSPTIDTSLTVSGAANTTALSVSSLLNTTASVVNVLDFGITVTAANASSLIRRVRGGVTAQTVLEQLDTSGNLQIAGYAAIGRGLSATAGGSTTVGYRFFNATAIGVFTGTGSPTVSAPRGSLYLRNDSFPYYNTDDSTGWAPLIGSTTGVTTQNLTSGSGATYTTPAGVKWIRIRFVGGGGGGGGTGASTGPTGATGGSTIFNGVNAAGGSGGIGETGLSAAAGGAGGTGGSGTATFRFPGNGGGASASTTASTLGAAGQGAASVFGGAPAASATGGATGTAAAANTGAGGGGANGTVASITGAGGGGSGEYVELIIVNPGATYIYTVGGGGAGGIGTGTGAATGGAGGSGRIVVDEHYTY